MQAELTACAETQHHTFETSTRQVSIRNTGTNTIYVSLDSVNYFDVAAGTSWDDRVTVVGFWYCTQLGRSSFVVNGIALNKIAFNVPTPAVT
jgi:hypothetical protein